MVNQLWRSNTCGLASPDTGSTPSQTASRATNFLQRSSVTSSAFGKTSNHWIWTVAEPA
ncbi:hypothetical protein ACHAXR_008827 [Thalassiosira sp. AJA248-18]